MAKLAIGGLTAHYEKKSFQPLEPGNYSGIINEIGFWAKEPVFDADGETMLNATALKGKIEITEGKLQGNNSDPAGRRISFFFNFPADEQSKEAYEFNAMRIQSLLLSAGVEFDEEGADFNELVDKTVKFTVGYQRDKSRKFKEDDNGNKIAEVKSFLYDNPNAGKPSTSKPKSSSSDEDFDFS